MILQAAHDTLPGGDDEDRWNEFSAVFITALVRRALAQLRDSQARYIHFIINYYISFHYILFNSGNLAHTKYDN